MIKKVIFLVPLIFLMISFRANPQQISLSLKLFDNLSTIDYGNLAFINGLSSTQQIFYVEMLPAGIQCRLQGKIEWQRSIDSRTRELFVSFRTKAFPSQNFYNTNLGSTEIQMDFYNVGNDIINDLMALGKPSGIFWFTLEVMNPLNTGIISNQVVEKIVFLNPSQSMMVTSPLEGSSENTDNVLVQWTPVNGVTEYKIKANVKKGPDQSPEEALNQGDPIVDNLSAGLQTSMVLSSANISRQWNYGDEIVLQVSAFVTGPSGGMTVFSNIVTFKISANEDANLNNAQSNLVILLSSLGGGIANELARKILSGEIQLTGSIMLDGQPITLAELLALLQSILADQESILGITPPN